MVSVSPTQTGGRPESIETGRRASPTAAPVGASIGAMLRERRVALGATLGEVEAATKIRQKYLSALEADEWQALPGEVVGRGFLRNYAGYLGLEATEIIERRRAVADPSLSGALASTSAGSSLPPVRAVDYRPKDVDLREEPDTLEERQPLRLGPILLVVAALAVMLGLWWGLSRFGGNALDTVAAAGSGLTDRVAGLFASNDATATPD
ncbi:MAG: helix-turn-helix domain-containing protein, partial [Caldilineaceae bacterium]